MGARESFSGRWGFLAAALGMAIGTGNIWRFPRVAAANGGGAFLIPWMIFLFLWSVPLLLVELGLGRKTRRGTVGAFGALLGPRRTWMGAFVGLCTLAIMFYYSVVAGWCFRYLAGSILWFDRLAVDGQAEWARAAEGPAAAGFHLIAMALCAAIVMRGITRGVEAANKVLIPLLVVMLGACVVRSLTLPGAARGLEFLFDVRWEYLARPRRARRWPRAATASPSSGSRGSSRACPPVVSSSASCSSSRWPSPR